jgi:hypothetical protein
MRFLHNLRATDVAGQVDPWAWAPEEGRQVPPNAYKDKRIRDLWINNPETRWCVYNAVEGTAPNLRVNAGKGDAANQPHAIEALIVDFDCPASMEEIQKGIDRSTRRPNWWETTLSGNGRGVWLFAKPLKVPGYKFASGFLGFVAEKLKVRLVAPGVDEGALVAPERYYTNSGTWTQFSEETIPESILVGWMLEFGLTFREFPDADVEIPMEEAARMLAAKYPRFSEWSGAFELNSLGPSFWIQGSTSPKSALVKPGGLLTFAAHATKSWYPWDELLGKSVVDEYRANLLGAAVGDVFYDGKHYYRQIASGMYKPFNKEDLCQDLKVKRGLSSKVDKSGVSQMDKALSYIRDNNYVVGAAPLTFQPRGLVRVEGEPVLNTATRQPLPAHPDPVASLDECPFIRDYLNALFWERPEQQAWLLSWLHVGYCGALAKRPQSGHNLFLVGGPSVGKTLFSRRVVGALFGGSADASEYLLGEDDFGGELFESYIWRVDDNRSTTSAASHRKFSEIVKRMAANTTFRYHCKFRQPILVEWRGRVICTLNSDEESARAIPDLGISIKDKIALLRVADDFSGSGFRFPRSEDTERNIERELPKFARFIRDYVIPDGIVNQSDPRYVIHPYHDESLLATARHSSAINGFHEILEDWVQLWFSGENKATHWEGTAYQLHKALHENPTAAPALRAYTIDSVQRALSGLKSRQTSGISCRDHSGGLRLWKIERPESLRSNHKSTSLPSTDAYSK